MLIHAHPVPLREDADGNVRVGDTRVSLHTVVSQYNAGATPEDIVPRFDVLNLADVYAIVGYYLRHRDEVDTRLAEDERAADEALARLGPMYRPGAEVRAVLEARLAAAREVGGGAALPGG